MILPHFQEVFKRRCLTVFCEWQDKRLHKTRHKGHCLIWGWSIPVALGVSGYVCETLRLGGYQHLPALSFSLPLAMCSPCLHPPLVFSSMCAMFLVQQFLSGHISVWGELWSCAHPTLLVCARWQGQFCSSQDWRRVAQLKELFSLGCTGDICFFNASKILLRPWQGKPDIHKDTLKVMK